MKTPLLSVIVPVFNAEKYLDKCLLSIINQTFEDIEIVCIDDGSTDRSLSILLKYSALDNRIKVISQRNSGIAYTRNVGLKNSTAKYITFVDSDDYIELNTYEYALAFFQDPHIDIVHWGVNLVKENENAITYSDEYTTHKFTGKKEINSHIIKKMDVYLWNKIIKKEIIIDNDIQFPSGLLYEDHVFLLMYLIYSNNIYFIKEKLYYYISHQSSIMNGVLKKSDKSQDQLDCFKYFFNYMKNKDRLVENKEIIIDYLQHVIGFTYEFSKKENIKKLLEKSRDIMLELELDNIYPDNEIVREIKERNFYKIPGVNYYTLKQKLFSYRETEKHHILYILLIKIKIRKNNKQLIK
ncbi:glycosyltransferase [Pectobacterium aquaticum]|nr:glycosyltransferase family 2 protein [Pectobacterium aquaticum]